jgi:predicted secreted protein
LISAKAVTIVILVAALVSSAAFAYSIFSRPGGGITTSQNGSEAVYPLPTANTTSTITARLGEVFAIQLNSNAGSTGFDWKVSCTGGIQYLNYTVVSTSTLIGGPQVRDYFFRAVTAGSQTITLQDMRPFTPYEVAATITVQITVT